MSDVEPLFALLEVMLRTFAAPKVKPGGHGEEIFVDLTEEEKEEFECSICYQILKETRQCENKHKFCNSCIYVWSTSGSPVNHSRCPVCRVDGFYLPNTELDEKINRKRVKCALKSCKWSGPLKHLGSHQHLTYPVGRRDDDDVRTSELPLLRPRSRLAPSPVPSFRNSLQTDQSRGTDSSDINSGSNGTNTANTAAVTSVNVTSTRSTSNTNTNRSRGSGRNRHTSVSPTRRHNTTATGLNHRLTNRGRIQNNGESVTPRVPRPPAGPRPTGRPHRRIPTLPSIVHNDHNANTSTNAATNNTDSNVELNNSPSRSSDNNNNNITNSSDSRSVDSSPRVVEVNPIAIPERRRYTVETAQAQRAVTGTRQGFTVIRDRLNESRQRLDALMSAFTVELDRGRQDLTSFQEERERRRQEQLEEVRELGRRLGHVAQELRGLLTQRRQIRDQIDRLVSEDCD